jgi:hypothetical protein
MLRPIEVSELKVGDLIRFVGSVKTLSKYGLNNDYQEVSEVDLFEEYFKVKEHYISEETLLPEMENERYVGDDYHVGLDQLHKYKLMPTVQELALPRFIAFLRIVSYTGITEEFMELLVELDI